MLVIPDSWYCIQVPIQMGTGAIDDIMKVITLEELGKVTEMWKHTHLSTVLANKISKTDREDCEATSLQGDVATTKPISTLPSSSKEMEGVIKIRGHTKMLSSLIVL